MYDEDEEPKVISGPAQLGQPSPSLMNLAHHAIFNARNGGVHEPQLRDPVFLKAGLQVMGASSAVETHRDSDELPRWSYHYIIENAGFIVKHPLQEVSLMPTQPAGTLLRLEIHEEHTLVHDYRSPNWTRSELASDGEWAAEERGWASLHFGSDNHLTIEEAEAEMRRRIAKLEEIGPPALVPMFRDREPTA